MASAPVFVPSALDGKFHANVTFYYREESPILKLEHKSGTNILPTCNQVGFPLILLYPPGGSQRIPLRIHLL